MTYVDVGVVMNNWMSPSVKVTLIKSDVLLLREYTVHKYGDVPVNVNCPSVVVNDGGIYVYTCDAPPDCCVKSIQKHEMFVGQGRHTVDVSLR
jgi:hypothetical protein